MKWNANADYLIFFSHNVYYGSGAYIWEGCSETFKEDKVEGKGEGS